MHIQHYIPAGAAAIYMILFGVTVFSRPSTRQKKLFTAYIVSAMLWSVSDLLLRNNYWNLDNLLLFRIVLVSSMLWVIQLYWFSKEFLQMPAGAAIKLGYGALLIFGALCFAGIIPPGITIVQGNLTPVFGWWMVLYVVPMFSLAGMVIYALSRKLLTIDSPEERNKVGYLVWAIGILACFGLIGITPLAKNVPFSHIGGLLSAAILAYAVARHELISINLVLRRALGWAILNVVGVSLYVSLLVFNHLRLNWPITTASIIYPTAGMMIVSSLILWLRPLFLEKIDQMLDLKKYAYRKELFDFVAHKIRGVRSLQELSEGLLTPLENYLNCQQVVLLLPDKDGDGYAAFGTASTDPLTALSVRKDSAILAWLRKEYLTKKDLDIRPEFRGVWSAERSLLDEAGVELLFPLISKGSIAGILAFKRKRTGSYSFEDAKMLENISNTVAISLEKESFQSELAKREKELSIINRLTRVMTSSPNIQDVYDSFVRDLREAVDIDFAAISMIDAEQLQFAAMYNTGVRSWKRTDSIPLRGSGMEWIALSKKYRVYSSQNSYRDEEFIEQLLSGGANSIICLPLMTQNEVFGILTLTSLQQEAFGSEQTRFLEQVAAQISTTVLNSQLYSKLQTLYRSEKESRQELEKEIKKRADFFRALVHELKTPLTPILASSEIMMTVVQEGTLKDLAENIYQGAERLGSRVDELLDMSRGELGMLKVHCQPMDMAALIDETARCIQSQLLRKRQTLAVFSAEALPQVMGDAARLRQVLLNLLTNSMKFTAEGGEISLRAKTADRCLIIEIQDNGRGIDECDLDNLFKPYNQLESSKQNFSGLGLGLALCKQFVELHGGKIWVVSQKGRGSTFSFSLPLAGRQAGAESVRADSAMRQ